MRKRAVLRLTGSCSQGFQVILEIQEDRKTLIEANGRLSASLDLADQLQAWQQEYRHWLRTGRISLDDITIEPIDESAAQPSLSEGLKRCQAQEQQLHQAMATWLAQESFRPVELTLRDHIQLQESLPILLRSEDPWPHQLPWQVWTFIQDYSNTEVILAEQSHTVSTSAATVSPLPSNASTSTRVQLDSACSNGAGVQLLAVFGEESRALDLDVDRQVLNGLPDKHITVLEQPTREQLGQQLWQTHWDIFFFAGHSHSRHNHSPMGDSQTRHSQLAVDDLEQPPGSRGKIAQRSNGVLRLNQTDLLSLEDLRHDLRRAIANGLHLAIFNSCDGLGLAYDLEALHIPQLIVMREPVPDAVAHAFLRGFTTAFADGKPIHLALREAREQLQRLEDQYPGASALPVLFQNPALEPLSWRQLQTKAKEQSHGTEPVQPTEQPKKPALSPRPQGRGGTWPSILAISCIATLLAMGSRYLGLLQTAELGLYDHWLRSRPAEPQDDRIVIIGVDDAAILEQPSEARQGRSLSDATLYQILQRLETANPGLIGLDIYREQRTDLAELQQELTTNSKLFGICKDGEIALNQEPISPPPGMPLERVGFSNVRSDRDGVARIQLLASNAPSITTTERNCSTDYALAAALAEEYLFQSGFDLEFVQGGDTWQWNDTKLTRIGASSWGGSHAKSPYGPYANIETSGHQILLNYRASSIAGTPHPAAAFPQITVQQLLSADRESTAPLMQNLEDKIVLIGVTAETSSDRWRTPYRSPEGQTVNIPGVYLQAQMTSQIISAVIDGRPRLWSFPFWLDSLGVFSMTMLLLSVRNILSNKYYKQRKNYRWELLLWSSSLLVFLYAGSIISFRKLGLYLPALPCAFSLGLGISLHRRLDSVKPHE